MWANYYFLKKRYTACGKVACAIWYQWELDHFSGELVEINPNNDRNGNPIGVTTNNIPTFDGNPNHWVKITPDGGPFVAHETHSNQYGFDFNAGTSVGPWLSMRDISAYNTETKVKWDWASGCGHTRVLWGSGTDPGNAPVVQATCRDLTP